MKANIGGDRWIVAVGIGGHVIAESLEKAEQIERDVSGSTVTGVALGVLFGVCLVLWLVWGCAA